MKWNEEWRQKRRPHPSEIPEQYALWPANTDRLMVAYFTVVALVTYMGLEYLGARPVLVAGLPVLMVVTMGVSLLFIVGLLLLAHRASRRSGSGPSGDLPE